MSAVTSSRRWAPVLLLGLSTSLFLAGIVGCGGDKEIDPYVYASLRAVTTGAVKDTVGQRFLFEIDAPQFDYARGNTAIVRDGNWLAFVVGSDLENQYRTYAGSLLGVQKFFSPDPFLMIKRVKKAGVSQPVDSCTAFVVPKLLRGSAVDLETPGADLPAVRWNRQSDFATFKSEDKDAGEIQIQSMIEKFVLVPRPGLPDSVKANPSPQDMAWYAVFPESTFEIVQLAPGAEWVLHLLRDKDLPLVGSFTVTEITNSLIERRKVHGELGHIVGKLKVNWFRYANAFVRGTPVS